MRGCRGFEGLVDKCYSIFALAGLAMLHLAPSFSSGICLAQNYTCSDQQCVSSDLSSYSVMGSVPSVDACEKQCNQYYMSNDTLQLLASLRRFEEVALQCGDDENFLYARMWRLSCYYNFSMRDSFFSESSAALKLFTQKGHERYRYDLFRLRVQYYLFSNEFHHALQEAERLVRMAQEEESGYGLGISHFTLAFVFQLQYAYGKAAAHYGEALSYLRQDDPKHLELRLHCFDQMADCYANSEVYDKLDSVNRLWRSEFQWHRINLQDTSERNQWQLSIERFYLSLARYWMACDSLSQAWGWIDSAARFVHGALGEEAALLIEKETWFQRAGLLDSALAVNDRLLALNGDDDLSRSRLDHRQVRAQLLLAAGNYSQAARLYDSLLSEKNSIFKAATMQASMELSAILEAERARQDALKSRLYSIMAGVVVLFSLVIAAVLWRKNRQTVRKNRILVEKVEHLALTHDAIQELQLLQGLRQTESKERDLYEKLEAMMRERHLYLDAKMNRESLARELGTNSTYLANAIKACRPGLTVGKYVMEWRVAYARNLLASCHFQIAEVAEKSGFITRAAMNRAFNECYGMSPSEYRGAVHSSKNASPSIGIPSL